MTSCVECHSYVCDACSSKCPRCEGRACCDCDYIQYCETCSESSCDECTTFLICEGSCGIMQCQSCVHNGAIHKNNLEFCVECEKDFCSDCRYDEVSKDWGSACGGCMRLISGIIGKKLQEEKARSQKLQHEVDALKSEVASLRIENEDLRAKDWW